VGAVGVEPTTSALYRRKRHPGQGLRWTEGAATLSRASRRSGGSSPQHEAKGRFPGSWHTGSLPLGRSPAHLQGRCSDAGGRPCEDLASSPFSARRSLPAQGRLYRCGMKEGLLCAGDLIKDRHTRSVTKAAYRAPPKELDVTRERALLPDVPGFCASRRTPSAPAAARRGRDRARLHNAGYGKPLRRAEPEHEQHGRVAEGRGAALPSHSG
jgi:hypothetical protein